MTFADLPFGPLERAFVASLQRLDPGSMEPVLALAPVGWASAHHSQASAGGLKRIATRPTPRLFEEADR